MWKGIARFGKKLKTNCENFETITNGCGKGPEPCRKGFGKGPDRSGRVRKRFRNASESFGTGSERVRKRFGNGLAGVWNSVKKQKTV